MATNQEKIKVSFKELAIYERRAFRVALADMGFGTFVRSASVAVSAYAAQYYIGLRTMEDTQKMVLTSLGAAALVCLSEFAYHLARAPAKLHKQAELEAEQAKLASAVMQKERDEKPRLDIKLLTSEIKLTPVTPQWQVVVEVLNTSNSKDVESVELFVDSLSPSGAVKSILCPAGVEITTRSGQRNYVREYEVERLKPLHSACFAVVTGAECTGWLGVKHQSSNPLGLRNFPKITIGLRASGSMVEPAYASLILTGTGEMLSMLNIMLFLHRKKQFSNQRVREQGL